MTNPSELISQIEQDLGTSSSELATHRQRLDGLKGQLDALQGADLDPAEMLRVQMKLQQIALQAELMAQVVSRSEQSIDDLLKDS
jgi:type III secretion system YscI/HrpB-like protein